MTKAEVILKAIKNGATDAELATLEATPEDQFNNEEVGKPSGAAAGVNAGVVPVNTELTLGVGLLGLPTEDKANDGVTYEYRSSGSDEGDDFQSGWVKNTDDLSPLNTVVEPIEASDVPDEEYNAYLAELRKRREKGENLHQSQIMELDRPSRKQSKEHLVQAEAGINKYLETKKIKAPVKPEPTQNIPQGAMLGDFDGGQSPVQGSVAATAEKMAVYNTQTNLYNQKQELNNSSDYAEYYRKASVQLKNQGMGTSEEEVAAQAVVLATQDMRAEHMQRQIRAERERQSKTIEGNILVSEEQEKDDKKVDDYSKLIAQGTDADGKPVYGTKLKNSIEETDITETMLIKNSQDITTQKKVIDNNNAYWNDQFRSIETELDKYSSVPDTISALNDLGEQIKIYTDRAEGGQLPEKEYAEYKRLVDEYNKMLSSEQKNIDSYMDVQKKAQDMQSIYNSPESANGKIATDKLTASYNLLVQGQGDLYRTYQFQVNDQNGMIEDYQDMGAYIDAMGRNHNNIAQLGGILTDGIIGIGMTVETVKHQLNPRTLIADGLREYYKGDPSSAPDMVKGLLSANDYLNIPRDEMRRAVSGVQDYLKGSLQQRIEWKDLGDGIDDTYEWGEYILGAAADFVPQLALMTVAPQASLYILATSAAGGKYEQLLEENKHGGKYSMAEMYFASAFTGFVEYGTEKVTLGLLKKTGTDLTLTRNEGWKNGIKRIFNPENVGRGLYDMGSESTSEIFAKVGENFADIMIGKNISILDGVDEAAFNGLVMSGIMKSPVAFKQVISPFMRPEDSAVFKETDKAIFIIEKQLAKKDLSEETRTALKKQLVEVIAKNSDVVSRIIDNADEMTVEEFKIIQNADISLSKSKETIAAIKNDDSILTKDKAALVNEVLEAQYKVNKQKNEVLREVNLRHDMKVSEKGLKKLDPNARLEAVETRDDFQKKYEEITGRKDDARNKDAFFDPVSGDAYVNKTRAKEVGAVSAGSHELLHKIMKNVLNEVDTDGNLVLSAKGEKMIKGFLNSIPAKHRAVIQKRIDDNYKFKEYEIVDGVRKGVEGKEKNFKEYAEEYLNSYSDAIRKKEINPKDGDLLGAGRKLRDFFSDSGYENLKFNSGRDVKNFIKDYAADIKSGEVRESILAVGEGDGAQVGDVKFSESAFEDASVVEDLGLKDSTADIVRKNNKINDVILREGIKDKDGNIMASPAMQKELAKNNLPRAFALARQAAGKANDLTLEESLKMNDVMEFFSEYALKLTELARTYRAEKNGKKVPFGAYMNTLLPLKYSGILNKLKNKVQASSMSEEATAKEVGKLATPSAELANNEVEGRKVALNTIGQAEIQELLVNIIKKGNIKLFKYKDVKSELTKHRKFIGVKNAKGEVIEEIEITPELKAQYKKDGKKPPKELKSLRKPSGQLYPALEAVSAIFSVDPARIITEQDLDGPQRKAAQNEILKFTNEIIAMMPFGTTASGDATGIANTKLGLFFEKGSKTLMKDTGSGKGLNKQIKQNIDPTAFRTLLGLVAKARVTNTSVDGAIRAVVVQVATIAANQAIRQTHGLETNALKDGKASVMFSETYAEEGNYSDAQLSKLLILEQSSWKSILERKELSHIDMNSEVGREMLEMWIWENGVKQMPSAFWKFSGNWSGTTNKVVDQDGNETRVHAKNLLYRSVPELKAKVQLELNKQAAIQYGIKAEYNSLTSKQKASVDAVVFPADSKYSKQELKDLENALNRKALTDKSLTDQEYKDSKRRGIELIWKSFDNMIKNNPTHATYVAAILASSSAHQRHFMRITALHEFDTLENGPTTEEHQQPATDLSKFLFNRMLHGHLFGKNGKFKVAIESHSQGRLLNIDDAKLKNKEEGWSYQSNAGEYAYPILMKGMSAWVRYFNPRVNNNNGGINPNSYKLANGNTVAQEFGVGVPTTLQTPTVIAKQQELIYKVITGQVSQAAATKAINSFSNAKFSSTVEADTNLDKAVKFSSTVNAPRGITVLDFDDTLATSKSLIRYTKPDGTKGTLNAEQYAAQFQELTELGYEWDFSEFNEVVEGKIAPLFNKAMKLQGKFGPENMFVLTARPAGAAEAIFEFLQANGLNIPIGNITGLGNSTGAAKANWIAEKVGEGYNDFYFADDAMQNVTAVKEMLDRFDVKSKVQQAKVKFSETLSPEFNDILERTTGVESLKQFSDAQAKIRGAKTKYKSIIPASAQDFKGLLYNFLGKGKQGEADMAFFQRFLIDPFARGINELNESRQNSANDYKNLQKAFPETHKILKEKINNDFNVDQAIRVYLWNKAGFEVPGLSKRDLKTLVEFVQGDAQIQAYADGISLISKKENGYSKPGDFWLAENITSDLLSDGSIGDARADVMTEWQQNVDIMFSKENLNKIEAIYGSKFREALEDSLYRMRTGKNRPAGGGRIMNTYMNWVNNSVGAIMFFNMRSAILQTISATNYINWSFNNPAKAAIAFANQPQFWKDFSMLFNSPYLKQRRSGNQRGINEAELSAAVAGAENKAKAAIAWLLKKGFLPTQLADSFAIASGGATFYRNKVKALVKEGMTQEQAEKQAFLAFQETTEVSQQSARPDMISQQQASPLGRLILSFQNTPMQYARIMNKASRDLTNGRGDTKTHLSKIAYYGVAQSILFGALQSALMASMGDDEEEDFDKKKERILNGMIDSVLSGIGYGGKAVSTIKNSIREYIKQKDKGWNADHTYTILSLLSFSPPIGSKLRKIYGSIQTEQFNQGVFKRRGLTLDNPIWSGIGNVVEGVTNIPLGRISQKMLNIDNAMDDSNSFFERAALLLGWNTWDLGIKDPDIEAVKDELDEEKKAESKKRAAIKKEQKKKEKIEANIAVIEENKKKSKKDGICSAISKGGTRCKTKVVEGDSFCTIHEKTPTNSTGVKSQCKKIKDGGKQCGMQTASKSGLCYYHD